MVARYELRKPRSAASLGTRGWLQALRILYDADRLGLVGRLAGKVVGTAKRLRKGRAAQ